jgi:hypothetical protein
MKTQILIKKANNKSFFKANKIKISQGALFEKKQSND